MPGNLPVWANHLCSTWSFALKVRDHESLMLLSVGGISGTRNCSAKFVQVANGNAALRVTMQIRGVIPRFSVTVTAASRCVSAMSSLVQIDPLGGERRRKNNHPISTIAMRT
jgi:hypothetical protein